MANSLGKGLDALIKSYSTDSKDKYLDQELNVNSIIPNKNQPRSYFDSQKMQSLIESIKLKGIMQPLSVRKIQNNKFELIAGERRLRAAVKIGLKTVPAYILNIQDESEMMEYALIENIQRVDLNAIEEAEGYAILSEKYNLTHKAIASAVSKSRTEISNKLRLLKLPSIIKNAIKNNAIDYGHARALISAKKSKNILKIFKIILERNLNVRQTEKLVKTFNEESKKTSESDYSDYEKYERHIHKYLETKVIIKFKSKSEGSIIIPFHSEKELKKIIKKLNNNEKN